MLEECKKNQKFYTEVSGLYPKGRYLGVVNQQVVAEGNSKLEVERETMEEFLKCTGGVYPEVIPTVVRRVGFEDEQPQVIDIEVKQVTFHPLVTVKLDWKSVAVPAKTELEPRISLDRFWHNIRFVGPDQRPYITLAASFQKDSVCFPMTFLIGSGSPANFIKESAFDNIPALLNGDTGEKVLYIGGERIFFLKPPATIHSNINILGTPTLHLLDYILKSYHSAVVMLKAKPKVEEGRNVPPEPSDWK